MRVKRFHGETIQEAVAKMKQEFGSDAVILHTKRVKHGGFFGLFGRQVFEVIGAMEASEAASTAAPEYQPQGGESKSNLVLGQRNHNRGETEVMVKSQPTSDELWAAGSAGLGKASKRAKPLWPDTIDGIYQQLLQCDLPQDMAQALMKEVLQAQPQRQWRDLDDIWPLVREQIANEIETIAPWDLDGGQKRAVLVGPTGVGKTTTIAKLAANFALVAGKKVGLITVDTYRIGAVDQLRTYAEIIGVPLQVAYSPEGLRQAIADMPDRDLVLIDTAGRSQRNESQMTELKNLLAGVDAEIHLVVSATTKARDLSDIIRFFSGIEIHRLIVTKVDETTGFGVLLQATSETNAPIAYITTGQSVPEDIEVAEPQKIAEWILGD